MKAVILCGGASTRLRPLTDNIPKCLFKIFDRCIIDLIIEKLIAAGVDEIYISSGIFLDEITEFCEKQHYPADIIYCDENKPAGSAGGIKSAFEQTDEKFLVLSGDIYFDFSVEDILEYHDKSFSDMTVCCIGESKTDDNTFIYIDSDNSVEKTDNDDRISGQERYINTEIYVLSPGILKLIPDSRSFDIENDLIPSVFKTDMRLISYIAQGNYFNINTLDDYKKLLFFLLAYPVPQYKNNNNFIFEDTITNEGAEISAPCYIGNDTVINSGAVIGPFAVLGDKCSVGHNVTVKETAAGDFCRLYDNSDITGSVLSENVKIYENCSVEPGCAIGYGCIISRFCRIASDTKIWPGKRIRPQSSVSGNIYCETPLRIEFNSLGISGKVNFQFTPSDALRTGMAVASIPFINKIGIGCDSAEISDIYKDICCSGMRACGVCCYDFGKIYKSQTYFFSAYCCLDAFIYISVTDDIISFSFSGKNGMPVLLETERNINNNYRFSAFSFSSEKECTEKFNMQLLDSIYLYYLKKISGNKKYNRKFSVETDNSLIRGFTDEVFCTETSDSSFPAVQILINSDGKDFYIIEEDKSFSYADILVFVCEIHLADGKDIIVKEDAPDFLEEKAKYYGRKVFRVYDYKNISGIISNVSILENIWAFDPIFLIAEMINIVSESAMSLSEIFRSRNKTEIRSVLMEYNCSLRNLVEIIKNSGAEKTDDNVYYLYKNHSGRARIRELGNSKKLRILVQAENIEAAKELSAEVCGKLKDAYIDKD